MVGDELLVVVLILLAKFTPNQANTDWQASQLVFYYIYICICQFNIHTEFFFWIIHEPLKKTLSKGRILIKL